MGRRPKAGGEAEEDRRLSLGEPITHAVAGRPDAALAANRPQWPP
jgi:hypothetical protein